METSRSAITLLITINIVKDGGTMGGRAELDLITVFNEESMAEHLKIFTDAQKKMFKPPLLQLFPTLCSSHICNVTMNETSSGSLILIHTQTTRFIGVIHEPTSGGFLAKLFEVN